MAKNKKASPSSPLAISNQDETITVHEAPPDTPQVPEALVQDLWKHQTFNAEELSTTDGKRLRIVNPGAINSDAGPDFLNAHVRIDGMNWRGHVEVHNRSGGWFEHEHHTDPRYDSVVLHVTLHPDMWTGGLLRSDESKVPELVLHPHLEEPLRKLLYAFRMRSDVDSLPCASRWSEVPGEIRREWIQTLARQRMVQKREKLSPSSDEPLDRVLQERLFAGLGYSKNDEPMAMLAQRVSPSLLRTLTEAKNREALLIGTAGLLPDPADLLETDRSTADYAMDLRHRFRRLQAQYTLPPMEPTAWTFFRLRPSNFPPLRIAQAAAWYEEGRLFSADPLPRLRRALRSDNPVSTLRDALKSTPGAFWKRHYHLTSKASKHNPGLGRSRRDTLLVNAVLPVLLRDGKKQKNSSQSIEAINVLRTLPAPDDHVVRRFEDLGTTVTSAFEGQGLHQLYREYCTAGGCLDCRIGQYLLDRKGHS